MNATWLILPVVICLSQRLSHACDPLEGKSGASSRGNSSSNSLVVEPWDGSPGPPSVSTGRLVSSVGDTLLALTGRVVPPDFDPIVLAFGIGVMINRDSRGHSYFIVGGEILGFMKDEQLRKHLPRMFSLIKNESWGLEDDQIPS
ncbi:hypothetical protein YC2023_107952 [Brassica napus]